jgi:Tol biopolymer transport system component
MTSTGGQATDDSSDPNLSADGRYVKFISPATNIDANGAYGLFVFDRSTGRPKRVSLSAAGLPVTGEYISTMSPDGRYIAFTTGALATGQDNRQLYLRDRGAPAG